MSNIKQTKKPKLKVWTCKIVCLDFDLPEGFDYPPRRAAMDAVEDAGGNIILCASGWGGKLTKDELAYAKRHQLVDTKDSLQNKSTT